MEYSSFSPRADAAGLAATTQLSHGPNALSTAAETQRPVLAAAGADPARAKTDGEIQPLDTFEVGDNDHVPVPPEPPREATVLAVIADAPEIEDPAEPVEVKEPMAVTLREIDGEAENPTVDIRR